MQKIDAITYLAGIKKEEIPQADAPTNIHIITGEVSEDSEDGVARIEIDGFVISGDDDDEQSIEIDTLGGLEEGDTATILLAGETGKAMTPLAIGAPGSIDRMSLRISEIEADYIKTTQLEAAEARIGDLEADHVSTTDLNAATARIGDLEADHVSTTDLNAATGRISTLEANDVTINGRLDTVEADIDDLEAEDARISNLVATKADITDLNAATGRIATLEANDVTIDGRLDAAEADIDDLEAEDARIGNLVATKADITDLNAATARIGTIEADYLKAADMTAEQARVGTLLADYTTTTDLQATYATITNLNAATGRISTLEANDVTISGRLTAAEGNITNLQSSKADISVLESDYITADAIEAAYTKTDFSNTDVAWIQNGVIKDGSISSAMINDVSANKLTAGTINGSVINVTNLNASNITTGTINGQRIGEGSLSLSKLEDDVYTESEVDSIVSNLQTQIDGAIETWTGTAVPTLSNQPASSWTTNAIKDTHVGDVYFVVNSNSQQNGYNYRFTKSGNTYSWQLIKDSDVTNALQRLTTAEGKITTFDSDISQLKTDTGTLTTKTTSLETRMSDAEDDILDKVDTTTFNEVSDTVDSHSQSISQMTTTLSNKADSSTVSSLTTRVSKNEQDISGINTTIGSMQTTIESKADGSTVSTISNKLNTVSDTVDGHTQSISSITSTQTTMQGKLDKTLVETTQLWFSKANTTAPNKPTAQVTSTSTDGNAWRVVVPAYNASYPNYYYCYQWKYSDGTYGWSSVTRDIAMGESQERARTAITNAASAQSTANTANTNAASAVSTANTASTNASNALSTANTAASDASDAKADAATAVSTANTANTNASAAVSTANTASTNASTAVSTANTAKSTADTAKATADKNVKSTTQLWYTKANETAPAKPTAKVTSTAVSGNGWRVVVPTYASDYPYYFYCYQYELADGTFTWSDVVYDRATTENQSNSRSAVTGVSTLTTKTNNIQDTVDGHTQSLQSITQTQTSIQQNAVKSTVQLWFTKANTTAPNKPTAHVTTNNAATGNAWNLAVPTYNSSYPNYYYCYEYQYVDGSYGWSAVTRDIATGEMQATARQAQSDIDNLEIGGRNLILRSGDFHNWNGTTSSEVALVDEDGGTYATITPQSVSWSNISGSVHRPIALLNGKTVTISCDVRGHNVPSSVVGNCFYLNIHGYANQTSSSRMGTIDMLFSSSLLKENEWVRISKTLAFDDDARGSFAQIPSGYTYESITHFDVALYNHGGFPIDYRHPQLEYGNKPTDWTPAPEDVDADISTAQTSANNAQATANKNVKESQQLWFTKANNVAPNKPTAKVTSTSTGGNAWTTKVPTYISSYPHYFYCMQYIAADGTVTWSDVVYDQATTEVQSVARTASANLSTLQQNYATFKQTTEEFESTVGTTYATKTELQTTDDKIENLEIGGRNLLRKTQVVNPSVGNYNATFPDTISGYGITLPQSTSLIQWSSGYFKSNVLVVGETYTLSFTAWAAASTRLGCDIFPDTYSGVLSNVYFQVTTEKTRYTVTGELANTTGDIVANTCLRFWRLNTDPNHEISVSDIKFERGTKPTYWTPAPEDIDADISAIESRVTNAETSITQNTEQIALRAKSSDVYTKNDVNGLISTEVANRNSAIEQSASAINLSVSQTYTTKTEFNNLEIGGRNLLIGAATQNTSVGNMRESVTETDDSWLGCKVFRSSNAWADIGFRFDTQVVSRGLVKVGDVLTYSIWAKTDDTASRDICGVWMGNKAGGNHMSGVKIATLTSEWTRYEKQITITQAMLDDATIGTTTRFECNTNCTSGKYIYWAAPKLEKGTRATDWTPAPEDTKADVIRIANSNLTPFFSSHNPDGTYPVGDADGYWQPTADKQYNRSFFTAMDDGWVHINIASNNTSMKEFVPPRVNSLASGDKVTFLLEWRNVQANPKANFYTRNYPNNVQLSVNHYFGTRITAGSGEYYWTMTVNSTADGSQTWNGLVDLTFPTNGGSFVGDIRLSAYYGEYDGPYKPYVGTLLYTTIPEFESAKAEIKVTTDTISSTVEKVSSVKYLDTTYSFILESIKTYATEGRSGPWSVKDAKNAKEGDTVYIRVTDSTRSCSVYVKGTITGFENEKRLIMTSHGYEDILPVETIKSTINQSSDSVKILANHVDIDGAAIFTNGRLSPTSINQIASNASSDYTNLIKNGSFWNGTSGWIKPSSSDSFTVETDTTYGYCLKFVQSASGGVNNRIYTDTVSNFTHVKDKTYRLTFYAKTNATNTITAYLGTTGQAYISAVSTSTSWQKYEGRITPTSTGALTIFIGAAGTLWLANVVLVEDIAHTAIGTSQRIYYRTNANSSTPSAPSSWVTSTDVVNLTWTTKRVPYDQTYKYLYTCEQRKAIDGSFLGTTPVLLDDTTTVIDGGNIITGTVTANQIAAGAITAQKLNVGDTQNYSALDMNTASYYGFTYDDTVDGRWYTMTSLKRDTNISPIYDCKGGEKLRVTFEISSSVMGREFTNSTSDTYLNVGVGASCYKDTGGGFGWPMSSYVTSDANATPTTVNSIITLPDAARRFIVFIQLNGYHTVSPMSGTFKIRNLKVYKMTAGELIVDGTVKAAAISADSGTFSTANIPDLNADKITSGNIAAARIQANVISAINSLTAGQINADRINASQLTIGQSQVSGLTSDLAAKATPADITNAVNAIDIGGRNLLPWSRMEGNYIVDYAGSSNGKAIVLPESTATVIKNSTELYDRISNGLVAMGDTVTLSFMAVADGATTLSSDFYPDTYTGTFGNINVAVTSTPERYTITGTLENTGTPTSCLLRFWRLNSKPNYQITIWDVKWERGNKPTDWTVAPEDTDASIEKARTDAFEGIDNVTSSVDELASTVESNATEQANINAGLTEDIAGLRTDFETDQAAREQWLTFNGSEGLTIGEASSEFKTQYTSTDINFVQGDEVLMNLNGTDGVNAPKVTAEEVHLGNWVWVHRTNGNLSLKYIG